MKSDSRIKIWKGDITNKAACSQLIDEAELGAGLVWLGGLTKQRWGRKGGFFFGNVSKIPKGW